MTVWAADGSENDYSIQLWSEGARRVYGHTRDAALGASYIDVFVNPKEKTQAVADHQRMVQTGEVYEWG